MFKLIINLPVNNGGSEKKINPEPRICTRNARKKNEQENFLRRDHQDEVNDAMRGQITRKKVGSRQLCERSLSRFSLSPRPNI